MAEGIGAVQWSHVKGQSLVWLHAPQDKLADADVCAELAPSRLEVGKVLWPEEMDSANHLRLSIPFFREEQLGAAALLGPVGLDVIVAFCRELRTEMDKLNEGEVLCVCCSGRLGARSNSLLLVGAYLMLECGMAPPNVMRQLFPSKLGFTAHDVLFPRPWTKILEWTPDSMSAADCFMGIEAALEHGWWDYDKHDLGKRQHITKIYDAAKVCTVSVETMGGQNVQMSIWVSADPVTTVMDPFFKPDPIPEERERLTNPADPREVKLMSMKEWNRFYSKGSTRSTGSRIHVLKSNGSLGSLSQDLCPVDEWRERAPGARVSRKLSEKPKQEIIGKQAAADSKNEEHVKDLPTYARWLQKELNCRLLVRLNHSGERGLPGGSSYGDFFARWDVQQLEAAFQDGTPPPNGIVELVVAEVAAHLEDLQNKTKDAPGRCAVVVHCKSGLGRSMSVIGALAVALTPGLSASAFFGWSRLVRPGAIQTATQERFLRSLDEAQQTGACARCLCWRSKTSA